MKTQSKRETSTLDVLDGLELMKTVAPVAVPLKSHSRDAIACRLNEVCCTIKMKMPKCGWGRLMSEKKKTTISDDFAFWVGRAEARKFVRRFLIYPPVFAIAVVILAGIVLSVILWLAPNSAETVSRLFAVETFREMFPKAARMHSYLARRDEGPWDVFFPAMLMISMTVSLATAVLGSFRIFRTSFTSINEADGSHLELIARTRGRLEVAIVLVIVCTVFFAGLFYSMAFGVGFDPERAVRPLRSPIALRAFAEQLSIIAISFPFVGIAFLIKFWRMLGRLQTRAAPTS